MVAAMARFWSDFGRGDDDITDLSLLSLSLSIDFGQSRRRVMTYRTVTPHSLLLLLRSGFSICGLSVCWVLFGYMMVVAVR